MSITSELLDICRTCVHSGNCSLAGEKQGPIWECEEFSGIKPADIESLARELNREKGGIMSILEKIQAKYSYLPESALRIVARETGRCLVDIYGVATFYRFFSLKPRGKHLLSVCLGTACHVRGAGKIVEEVKNQLGIDAGETTADGEFTFETVNCLGACALGPIVVVDGTYFSKVKPAFVKKIIEKARAGLNQAQAGKDERIFPLEVTCPRCNHSLMDVEHPLGDFPAIHLTAAFGDKHGWARFSSLYGNHACETKHRAPADTLVDYFCPHCHAELSVSTSCMTCTAPMISLLVRGGGVYQICSREGCRGRMLDVNGVNI